jgi:hypothetical protein
MRNFSYAGYHGKVDVCSSHGIKNKKHTFGGRNIFESGRFKNHTNLMGEIFLKAVVSKITQLWWAKSF